MQKIFLQKSHRVRPGLRHTSPVDTSDYIRDAQAVVTDIADGLSRDVIETRARQAMASANEIRARADLVLEADKRGRAIFRAGEWADVIYYLDDTDARVFRAEEYKAWVSDRDSGFWYRLGSILNWIAFWRIVPACRVVLGKKPYAFYESWGPVTDAPSAW